MEGLLVLELTPQLWQFPLDTVYGIATELLHAFHKLLLAELTHGGSLEMPAYHQGDYVRGVNLKILAEAANAYVPHGYSDCSVHCFDSGEK